MHMMATTALNHCVTLFIDAHGGFYTATSIVVIMDYH